MRQIFTTGCGDCGDKQGTFSNSKDCKHLLGALKLAITRSNRPQVFSGKVVLKICSKFTGEHPCQSVISI